MKSIICHITSYSGISLIYVILAYVTTTALCGPPPPCGLYGAKPCQFVPAPPGQTPACARPGKTYCEHVDNYPTYLIKHLVHKWGYEAKNLLIDETWDDFAALAWRDTPIFFDPTYIFPHRHHYGGGGGGGGSGGGGRDFHGYNYETPSGYGNGGGGGGNGGSGGGSGAYGAEDTYFVGKQQTPTEPPTFLLYSSAGQRLNKNQLNHNFNGNLKVTPNNPTLWLKRIVRDLAHTTQPNNNTSSSTIPSLLRKSFAASPSLLSSPSSASSSLSPLSPSSLSSLPSINNANGVDGAAADDVDAIDGAMEAALRHTRDVSINMDLLDIVGVERSQRVRRQSPGRSTLCQTSSQFITPQAALNNKGNWMFVVNEPSTARQMVKAELCASNTCSNLCQLPNGYNSRCEQKFVQKRLIALQASGQNLYTDTFWFPSCCVCTISAN